MRLQSIGAVAAVLLAPALAIACLWDADTLVQERARFPSTLELITGKFLRHSNEFYEWRIRDRLSRLKSDSSSLALYDDLAVAYHKTGQNAKAIETILVKEKIKPGVYETFSNLGTFHILAGDFEQGLTFIDKALAINPNAHFGREQYQKWLVEYAITKQRDGRLVFPLRASLDSPGFHDFLSIQFRTDRATAVDTSEAVHAVLGMMRFANHDNPLLLEALGDLLCRSELIEDAKQLAARAYLKASYEVDDQAAKDQYRTLAQKSLHMQLRDSRSRQELTLAELEADFALELADAEKWFADLSLQESAWITAGKNADAEFARLYAKEPAAFQVATIDNNFTSPEIRIEILVGSTVALLGTLILLRWFRRPVSNRG